MLLYQAFMIALKTGRESGTSGHLRVITGAGIADAGIYGTSDFAKPVPIPVAPQMMPEICSVTRVLGPVVRIRTTPGAVLRAYLHKVDDLAQL